uniref:Carboxylic ester hydrolase n=1 Tax=Holotrichia parallela TaxID=93412 RepID=A0A6M3GU92_HOLPA|nr:carboxylesterase 2 [Holotrichia parallela]
MIMNLNSSVWTLLLVYVSFALCVTEFSPTVEIHQGRLRGVVKNDRKGGKFYSFLSVPYARKPVGNLRFMIPAWAEKWEGLLDAVSDLPMCLQHDLERNIIGQEDCLYLNVHTAELEAKDLKPVMVYIHGGGFAEGSGQDDLYGAEFLLPEGVVLVTINYRLGLFGFLNFENPEVGAFGNMGLKDQNMALRWVQRNIEKFGGNPKSVTIFGQSAGGASVHMHLLSPMSKGLFHRAIAQSGSALNAWSCNGQRDTGALVAKTLGFDGDSEMKMLPFLQSVSIEDILRIQENVTLFVPVHDLALASPVVETIDNEISFLPEHPEEIISAKGFQEVPFMIGYTDAEAIILDVEALLRTGNMGKLLTGSALLHTLNAKDEKTKEEITNQINSFYYGDLASTDRSKVYNLVGDAWVYWGAYNSLLAHSKMSHKDLYFYIFAADTELNYYKRLHPITSKYAGASHIDELGYLFKTKYTPPEINPDSVEAKSIEKVVKLWTNFAKYGNPTPKQEDFDIIWKPVIGDELNYLHIGTHDLKLGSNPYPERMAFWDRLHEEFTAKKLNLHTEL